MVITRRSIELLPNELWLLFMSFLLPIDLYRALIGLNHRINGLVFTMSPCPILDTSQCSSNSIRLSDMRQLLEGKDDWSKCLLAPQSILFVFVVHLLVMHSATTIIL